MSRYLGQLLIVGLVSCAALAADVNVIDQHNPVYEPAGYYYEVIDAYSIMIYHGIEGEPFEFEAAWWVNNEWFNCGEIDLIQADEDAGPVTITVVSVHNAQHNDPPYSECGAEEVKKISLNAEGVTGVIGDMQLLWSLGDDGDTEATAVSGNIHVLGIPEVYLDGNVFHDIRVDAFEGELVCAVINGGLYTAVADGWVWCDVLAGDVKIPGEAPGGVHNIEIDVVGSVYDGSMTFGEAQGIQLYLYGLASTGLVETPEGEDFSYGSLIHIAHVFHGDIAVGNDLGGDIVISSVYALIGGYDGSISVGRDVTGNIQMSPFPVSMSGQIEVGRDLAEGSLIKVGTLTVAGGVSIGGTVSPGASIVVDAYLQGAIDIAGDLEGGLELYAVNSTGQVTITGRADLGTIEATQASQAMAGTIAAGVALGDVNIAGDLTGTITCLGDPGDLAGVIQVGGDMSGRVACAGDLVREIRINGSLLDNGLEEPNDIEVEIGGQILSTGAVAVDWDGVQFADGDRVDVWGAGAEVKVDGTTYTDNDITVRVYYISPCHGDMNNDWSVNGGDIDGFVAGLFEPWVDGDYDLMYPGLLGSIVFHGDMNDDSAFNGQDLDGFRYCLFNSCPCPGGGRAYEGGEGEGDTPGAMAALFQEYVPAGHMWYVLAAVAEVAENGPNAEYWSAVLAALQ